MSNRRRPEFVYSNRAYVEDTPDYQDQDDSSAYSEPISDRSGHGRFNERSRNDYDRSPIDRRQTGNAYMAPSRGIATQRQDSFSSYGSSTAGDDLQRVNSHYDYNGQQHDNRRNYSGDSFYASRRQRLYTPRDEMLESENNSDRSWSPIPAHAASDIHINNEPSFDRESYNSSRAGEDSNSIHFENRDGIVLNAGKQKALYEKEDEYMAMSDLPNGMQLPYDNNAFTNVNLNDAPRRRRPLKEAVMTMRNAQRVAKMLGMMREDAEDSDEEERAEDDASSQTSEAPFKMTRRKCWAKACWSRRKHSHALRPGDARHRAKLLQSPENATGLSAWDQQQRKAKKRVKDLWQELLPFLYIWNKPMKIIEGQYGTGVVSYFVFLRWLLYLNLAIFWMVFSFIVLPQSIGFYYPTTYRSQLEHKVTSPPATMTTPHFTSTVSSTVHVHHWADTSDNHSKESLDDIFIDCQPQGWDPYRTHSCRDLYQRNVDNNTSTGIKRLLDLLQGTGFMENTALFPGWYNPLVRNVLLPGIKSYNLALAYILVTLVYFLFCLFMMVGYTTESVRESLKTSEGHLHKYCNLVFGGWDYCIEEPNPANRKHQSIIQELKSNLAEERRQAEIAGWSKQKLVTVYLGRALANLLVMAILVGTLYAIYHVCNEALKQEKVVGEADFKRLMVEFSPSLTVTAFNIILPIIFGQIVRIENYSIDFEIKMTLIRTVVIRLASVVSLIATFYIQIDCKQEARDKECNYCTNPQLQCWENYVGQQIYKLALLDFVVVVVSVFVMDFPRKLVVKYCSCKLAKLVGPQEFDIPKNVLDLVYSQTLCWLGTFYSPLLPSICVIKFFVFFYVKKLTLLVNYEPSKVPYRASRSNTFFVIVLMMSFVLSVVPVGFTIAKFPPSMGCSPFRGNGEKIWDTIVCAVESSRSHTLKTILGFLVSAVFGVPVFIILCLAIYYYSTVSEANHQMVLVLKEQLVLEGKDKSFLLARLTEVTKLHRLPNT